MKLPFPASPRSSGNAVPDTAPASLRAVHELIARAHDPNGRVLRYGPALTEDVPLEDTPLARNLAVLRGCDPLRTDNLHARWETEIRPAVRTAARVRDEEERKLEEYNRRAAEENAAVERRVEQINAQRAASLAPLTRQLAAVQVQLDAAHREATDAVAAAGGEYDPQAPDEQCVLRLTPRSLEAIAARLKLPLPEGDRPTRMSIVLSHVATAAFGGLFGISLGIITHFIRAGSLLRVPLVLLICLAIGAMWAYLSRLFLYQGAHKASERFYLGQPASSWAPFAALTVFCVLATLTFDAAVGQAGVLGLSSARTSGLLARSQPSDRGGVAAVLVALAFTLPYAGCAVWEGYLAGRYHPILGRLKSHQEQELRMLDAHRRILPEVQAALQKIARVKDELRRRADVDGRIRDTEARFDEHIAAEERKLRPIRDTPEESACQRIDQAIIQARCLQDDWMRDLTDAIRGCTTLPH
jgi:hypothetical protein